MNRSEFLSELRKKLAGLPADDILRSLDYYGELIDDRVEDGLSEEDAVAALGPLDDIVRQILTDTPLPKLIKEKVKPKRRLKWWEIVLLALGSPIWLSLGVAAFAVILSLYVVLWSLIVSVWAVFGAFIGCSLGCIVSGIGLICVGKGLTGIAMISAGLVCTGLAIFLFFGCHAATKGTLILTKKITLGIKNRFVKKEEVQ